jgi:non-specific serine/threonine protein kinase/serine/threonine-protein kinase
MPTDDTAPLDAALPTEALRRVNASLRATPERVGPYHVLAMIGEGGMGTVYKAERRHPFRQTVAIKVIKLGMSSNEVIARFESERQALARMNHPNVARVFDAGTDDTARPYFGMEYVAGVPIVKFADDNKLTIRQRLELFLQICEAIHHAHTKAIIHRDIKSSNVLAYIHDGKPTVKVIDFGIAKALTGDRLTDRTFNTERGQVIGTFDAMSPEQADGSPDIDTRTDVYSLGVLLYELLTGTRPFDCATLRKATDEEMRRIIREVEPPRPSTRLSGMRPEESSRVAAARQVPLDSLRHVLRRELEWIPLKAMRKERDRRYAGPLQLAEDIRNYLDSRPLKAGPESRVYRVRKFVRRNWRGVAASTAILLLLIGGIVGTSAGLINARTQRRHAETQTAIATEVRDFLKHMIGSPDPRLARGKPVLVVDLLDRAAKDVDRLRHQPQVQFELRELLAQTYFELDRASEALEQATAAERVAQEAIAIDSVEAIRAATLRGTILYRLGRLDEARSVLLNALDRSRVLGDDAREPIDVLCSAAVALLAAGDKARAAELGREAVERARRALGRDSEITNVAMNNYAMCLRALGRYVEAEQLLEEVLHHRRRSLGEDHPHTLETLSTLGSVLEDQQKISEAVSMYRLASARAPDIYGPDHDANLMIQNNLAGALWQAGQRSEAYQIMRDVADRRARTLPQEHPVRLGTEANVAFMLIQLGRAEEAMPVLRDIWTVQKRVLGEDHEQTLAAQQNLAEALGATAQLDECLRIYGDLIPRSERALGGAHTKTINYLNAFAALLNRQGRPDEALELKSQVLERVPEMAKSDPRNAALMGTQFALQLVTMKRYEQAYEPLVEAWNRLTAAGVQSHFVGVQVLQALVHTSEQTGRSDEAARWRRDLDKISPATSPATSPVTSPATAPAG